MNKKIVLERAACKNAGGIGSFGFSVMGGATAKLPAVVCSIEVGGPAAESKQIHIGDQLLSLNDEDLSNVDSKELVVKIRGAPSPSTFVFCENEDLRDKVYHVLRKQEEKRRREKLSSSNSESSIMSTDRSPSHLQSHVSKRPITHSPSLSATRELEIETSVNIGQSGEIVKIRGGKIVNSPVELQDTNHCNDPTEGKSSVTLAGDTMPSNSEGGLLSNVKLPTTSDVVISQTNDVGGQDQSEQNSASVSVQNLDSDNGEQTQASPFLNCSSRKNSKQQQHHSKAITLARQLYMLDGFRKSEVAAKLADVSEFGHAVASEYLKFFDFEHLELDECLRQFLVSFTLSGETQERERVMMHFSDRYFECNQFTYASKDIVHGITCALLLLNSDLHTDHGGPKMTFSQFVHSLQQIGVKLPKDKTKRMYESIKKKPLESGIDAAFESESVPPVEKEETRVYHVLIPGTFVEVELPESAPLFREGYVRKKNIMDAPHKKVPRGKRQWKPYYVHLKGFLMYFVPPGGQLQLTDTSNALVITHCMAMTAADYHKKSAVIRVTTSDWHAFLLQTNDFNDSQQWILSINKAAALYSAPPLAAPIGSNSGFQRPTFPLAPTRNTEEQQRQYLESRTKSINKELEEHQAYKGTATKNKRSSVWFEKLEFLQYEFNRFHIYLGSLHSDVIDFKGPLPTGLVPSPSISTLATTGVADELAASEFRRRSRDNSPFPDSVPRLSRDISPSPIAFQRKDSDVTFRENPSNRQRMDTYHR